MPGQAGEPGRHAESVLDLGKSPLRTVIANLPVAAYTCDTEGLITYFNRPAIRLWGRTPTLNDPADRFCGSLKLYSPNGAPLPHDQCWMARALQTGMEYNGHEIILEKPDGQRVAVLSHANPIFDDAGQLLGAANILVDISERKGAEQAKEQAAIAIESSQDAIFTETLDSLVVTWNRGAEKIFGYSAGEIIGCSLADLVPFNYTDEIPQIVAEIRHGNPVNQLETVRRTKDGRLIDVSLNIAPIRNADGVVAGVFTIARDITERRQLQKRLRESAELFHQLAANIDGYLWLNAPDDGQMFYMSPAYEKFTGRKAATLYEHPTSWTDIIHPDDRERVLAVAREPVQLGGRQLEYRIVRPDGAIRWIRDRAFPVRNAAGEIYRIAGIGEDITEQRQAKEKIALARDFYLSLLDRFPTLIGRSGLDGKYNYVNSTWLEFTGRTLDQELGDGWTQGVHPEDVDQCLKEYFEAFHARRPVQLLHRLRRHDGIYRWMLAHARPFNDLDGQFAGYIAACIDVTEKSQAMDELRESKKRVQALSHRLWGVRENERGRLARELHDGISQTLTSLALAIDAATLAPAKMRKANLNAARKLLESGMQQARDIANDLRPPMLDHLGPLAAILWLVGRFNARNGLQIHFRHDGISGRFDSAVETVVYRLVEEALTNFVQHAKANEAWVRIWIQDAVLNVQVEDQGVGFDVEAALASAKGAGLASIREQVEFLGGRLIITSGIGEGTSLLAQWPIAP